MRTSRARMVTNNPKRKHGLIAVCAGGSRAGGSGLHLRPEPEPARVPGQAHLQWLKLVKSILELSRGGGEGDSEPSDTVQLQIYNHLFMF